jgi:hypothetical protein
MAEQSHRDEMNAAIRAQRERHAAPRTIAPVNDELPTAGPEPMDAAPMDAAPMDAAPTDAAPPEAIEAPRRSMLDRLRGR